MRRGRLLLLACITTALVSLSVTNAFVLKPLGSSTNYRSSFCFPTKPHRSNGASSSLLPQHLTVGGEDPSGLDLQSVWNTATGVGALVVGALVLADIVDTWPRGSVNTKLVEAAQSTLGPQAGRGLFALENIPKDTTIGKFPGVISRRKNWVSTKDSEEAAVRASRYTWTLANTDILDPTLSNGQLPEELLFYGGLLRKSTLLALVNEPRAGYDLNVVAVVSDRDVAYVAERNIYKGEELMTDYGPMYNRRHYRQ
ncbi:Hypothetical protein NocV09_00402030 [Nannochloropsis oceanica]